MIDLQQLKELVAVADHGTVSQAAQALYISQPALSRSLQKTENEWGVALFARRKNKIELNDSGKLAVEFAKKLLTDFAYCIDSVKAFDKSKRNISVGSCAPAPMWDLSPKLTQKFPDKTVTTALADTKQLRKGLFAGEYHIVISHEKTDSADCICRKLCEERLYLSVPRDHKLASATEGIAFADMDGISMLLYAQIGTWDKVLARLPNTRFFVQSDRDTFNDLAKESNLPVFETNLSAKYFGALPDRVAIPIREDIATDVFYLTVLKKNKYLLDAL